MVRYHRGTVQTPYNSLWINIAIKERVSKVVMKL